jgi:uncharacterized protein DUF6968
MDLPDLGADLPPPGPVVASRELRFTAASGESEGVLVEIHVPVRTSGTWWCRYEITAESFSRVFALAGEDSMQALLGSICIISTELDALAKERGGQFSYFGDGDLMLPTMDWLKRAGDSSET